MYLAKTSLKPVSDFINSPAWTDLKRCLQARKQASANVNDDPHTAAHKGFKRDGWDEAVEMIEKLPFEVEPAPPQSPFQRPALDPHD